MIFLIYTYSRVDDARINMELIRQLYSPMYPDLKIVHCYNGKKEWYEEQYLEDVLLRFEAKPLQEGASEMIDEGMEYIKKNFPETDYVVVLASDTWILKPAYISHIVTSMQKDTLRVAGAVWADIPNALLQNTGISVDFFIVDMQWANAYELFPFAYGERKDFLEAYFEQNKVFNKLEVVFLMNYLQALKRELGDMMPPNKYEAAERYWYRMVEREPVHETTQYTIHRRMWYPAIGLIGFHHPAPKQKVLQALNASNPTNASTPPSIHGGYIDKLRNAHDLSYYNNNASHLQDARIHRLHVLQLLIDACNAKRYLEIGVERGEVFRYIVCGEKIAVDPVFLFAKEQATLEGRCLYAEVPSDVFFTQKKNEEIRAHNTFDVVFVDGLHTYEQSLRDVLNALDCQSEGGVIVMHDTNPQTPVAEHPVWSEVQKMPGFDGSWNGNVWKTVVWLRAMRPDLSVFTLPNDHGLTVIRKRGVHDKKTGASDMSAPTLNFAEADIAKLTYEDLAAHRNEWLNMKDEEHFLDFLKLLKSI